VAQNNLELASLRKTNKDLAADLDRTKKDLDAERRRFFREEGDAFKRQRKVDDKMQRTSAFYQMHYGGQNSSGPTGMG